MKKIIYLVFFAALFVSTACEDLIETSPVNITTDELVVVDAASAESVLLGAYNSIQSANLWSNQSIANPGVLSDELIHSGSFPTVAEMDRNDVLPSNVTLQNMWQSIYAGIYITNVLLERIETIEIAPATKSKIIGEAKFIRALLHFEVLKLWGDCPVATTSDLNTLKSLPRTASNEVYNFLESELSESATLLAGVDHGNRNRANSWAAKALQARVRLYRGDESGAGTLAADIINNGPYSLEADYFDVFAGNSTETIFEVFSSVNDQNGIAFQFRTNGRYEYAPSTDLINAFEPGDERADIIDNAGGAKPEAAKYLDVATGTDKTIILRLADMYLIRAEANLGTTQADDDVNAVRNRSGLGDITSVTLDDVLQERFVELCFEGHRWYDLKRTNRVDAVMSVVNPTTWAATDELLPIPLREIQQNPSLTQNSGY